MTSVKDFGAFVEILPGKDGLCHISELSDEYVTSVADVCKVGDVMKVKVIAIDDQDRVKLSRKAVLREHSRRRKGRRVVASVAEKSKHGTMPTLVVGMVAGLRVRFDRRRRRSGTLYGCSSDPVATKGASRRFNSV